MKVQNLIRKSGEVYHLGLKINEAKTINRVYFDHRIMAGVLDKSNYITTELSIDEMKNFIKRLTKIADESKIAKSILNDWNNYQDDRLKQKYLLTKEIK